MKKFYVVVDPDGRVMSDSFTVLSDAKAFCEMDYDGGYSGDVSLEWSEGEPEPRDPVVGDAPSTDGYTIWVVRVHAG